MANEDRIRRLQRRYEEQDRIAIESAIRHTLSTAAGRRWLWLFLAECRVFQQPFNGNALGTAFNCGELNVGQRLLEQITEIDPDGFLVMQKESLDVERTRRNTANTSDEPDAE